MANNRKPAANISKKPSAGDLPKATKENIRPRSSQTHASLNGAKDSEVNGTKDVETAALVASLRAEVDRLKKLQAAKPIEKGSEEIPRPTKITSLQDAMGLTENKRLYSHCRSVVRDVMAHAGIPVDVDWRSQDAVTIGKVAQVASSRSKQLLRYKANWATLEIMKTLIKNQRSYKKRIGSMDEPDDDEHSTSKDKDGIESEDGNDDLDDIYVDENGIGGEDEDEDKDKDEDGGKDIDGGADSNESEDEEGRKDINGGMDGGNDDEGRDGEGSSGVKQAGRKRKVTRDMDDELATATREKLRKKMGSNGGHELKKKALPKGRK